MRRQPGQGQGLLIDGLVDGMAQLPGQRIIVLTSAGFLTGTLEPDLDRLMDKARRAEVVINSLDARGVNLSLSGAATYDGIAVLPSGTGGAWYHNNDLDEGLRRLGMAPETVYLLAFSPTAAPDGHFHKLKVQLTAGKKYSLESRLGYTARREGATPPDPAPSKLDSEVTASDTITELPASFSWQQLKERPGITMVVHLDINRLHFKPWEGRQTQGLIIVAVAYDRQRSFVGGKRSELQLSLREATFAQLAKTGFTAALTIPAPPGNYQVRAVAQDVMEHKLSAASDMVEIK